MDVTASGTLTDTACSAARIPQLTFDARCATTRRTSRRTARFAGFDPAVASGRPAMKGTVGRHARRRRDGRERVGRRDAGQRRGDRADRRWSRRRSAVSRSRRATLDGDYHESTGDIRTLEDRRPRPERQASGTLALNDTGQSNLTVHADTPSLEEIGKLVDTAVTGIGKVDATITGNRTRAEATGT